MSRCRACNVVMTSAELKTNLYTGEPEDMCFKCCGISFSIMDDGDLPTSDQEAESIGRLSHIQTVDESNT